MIQVHATHITLSEGGEWKEVPSSCYLTRSAYEKIPVLDKVYYSIPYKAGDKIMQAQAAAIQFSDGSIWDNKIWRWR